jgi:hypothetical protein
VRCWYEGCDAEGTLVDDVGYEFSDYSGRFTPVPLSLCERHASEIRDRGEMALFVSFAHERDPLVVLE